MGIRCRRSETARRSACAVLLFVLVFPCLLSADADAPGAYTPALWVSAGDVLVKRSALGGETLLEIPVIGKAGALAVNHTSGAVWVYAHDGLQVYEPDGSLRFSVAAPFGGVEGDEDGKFVTLVVDGASGTAWLGSRYGLLRLDAEGRAQGRIRLSAKLLDAALDRADSQLWVLERGGLEIFNSDGTLLRRIALPRKSKPLALSFDDHQRTAWVTFKGELRRYDRSGQVVLQVALPRGLDRRLAADEAGGAWLAGARQLAHVDARGQVSFSLRPFSGEEGGGGITAIAADPADASLWVANERQLRRYAVDSRLLAHITRIGHPEVDEDDGEIRHLALYADVDPPELSLSRPTQGSYVDTATPRIELGYRDTGSGVAPDSVKLAIDGQSVLARCTPRPAGASGARSMGAQCTPTSVFPEGPLTLTATVADHAGNVSEVVSVRFTVDTVPPAITLNQPGPGAFTNQSTLRVDGVLSETARLTLNGARVAVAPDHGFTARVPLTAGTNPLTLIATDLAGNRTTLTRIVTLDTVHPLPAQVGLITVSGLTDGIVTVTGRPGSVEPRVGVMITNPRTAQSVTVTAAADGGFAAHIGAQSGDTLQVVLTDAAGNASTMRDVFAGNQPPVLSAIADRSVTPGTTLTFTLHATDADGDAVRYGVSPLPLPAHATLDAVTGVFRFRPDGGQSGGLELSFYATDGMAVMRQTVRITVGSVDLGAPTAVTGAVLDANAAAAGQAVPIAGAAVAILGTALVTHTDADGRFTLSGLPTGDQVLAFDGIAASPAPGGGTYAGFRRHFDPVAHAINRLDRPVYLPRIDAGSITPVTGGATTVVTNARLGVTLTVSAGAAVNPDGTPYTGTLSISEVPRGFAPATLPDTVDPGLLVTLQPVGVRFTTPGALSFPNIDHLAPGKEVDLWSVNPDTGVFSIVGTNRVSADGQRLETVSGGVRATDWYGPLPPVGRGSGDTGEGPSPDRCPCNQDSSPSGSRVLSKSGALLASLSVPGYVSLGRSSQPTLVYDSARADPRPVLPFDLTLLARAGVPPAASYGVSVGGVQQGPETFVSTAGLRGNIDETLRGAVDLPAGALPTGGYPYQIRLTSNYASSRISSNLSGSVAVVNGRSSPFGAGWGLRGLERLYIAVDGSVLLSGGNGDRVRFTTEAGGGALVSPSGDYSVLEHKSDGTYGRTLKDGTRLEFDPRGMETRSVDRNGNVTRYAYDVQRRLITITDPVGQVTRLDYASGKLDRLSDPAGRTTTFTHDGDGNLTGVTFPDGSQRGFGYDAHHRLLTETDARGFVTRHRYDVLGRLVRATLPDGAVRSASTNQATGWVDPASGTGSASVPAPVVRPPAAAHSTYIDGEGRTRSVQLNRLGQATAITDPAGIVTNVRRDPEGNPLQIVTPASTTSVTYDGRGNPLLIADSSIGITTFQYEPLFNQITKITDGLNNITTMTYDAHGNLTGLTSPENRTIQMAYGGRGLRTSLIDTLGTPTQFVYDPSGNLIEVINGSGADQRNTQLRYTPAGDIDMITDAAGQRMRFDYDLMGRVIAQTFPDGRQVNYRYDASGNLASLTPPGRPVHRYDYTPVDQQSVYTPPDVGQGDPAMRLRYNKAQQLTQILRPDGRGADLAYDSGGRLVSESIPRGQYRYAYSTTNFRGNPTGQLSRVTAPDGNILDYFYQGDRLRAYEWTGPVAGNVNWTYDQAGRISAQRVNDDLVYLTYDRDGQLVQAGNLNIQRDPRSGLVSGTALGVLHSSSGYNEFGELVTSAASGGSVWSITADLDHAIVGTGPLKVEGTITGVSQVQINSTTIPVQSDGTYAGSVPLSVGDNPLAIQLQDLAGDVVYTANRSVALQPATATGVRVAGLGTVDVNGSAYFQDTAGKFWQIPAAGGTPQQPAWLATASAVAAATSGPVYLLKGTQLWVHTSGGDRSVAELSGFPIASGISMLVGPDGLVYFSAQNLLYRVDSAGAVNQVAAFAATETDMRLSSSIWGVVAGSAASGTLYRVQADGTFSQIDQQQGFTRFAVDGNGRLCFVLPSRAVPLVAQGLPWRVLAALVRPAAAAFVPGANLVTACHVPGSPLQSVPLTDTPNSLRFDTSNRLYYGRPDNVVRLEGTTEVPLIRPAQVQGTLTLSGIIHSFVFSEKFERDAIGRITRKSDTVGRAPRIYDYTYDPAGRLTSITIDGVLSARYAYDANSNRLSETTPAGVVTGTYDAQDRLLTYGSAAYTYNANGDLEAKTEGAQTTRYSYDVLGNLTEALLPDGRRLEYLIDGQSRRIGKQIDGVLVQGFLYQDQLNPVAELNSSGKVVARFVYGTKPNAPDYMIKGGKVYRIFSDPLGSPRLVVEANTGAVAQELDYDAFGNVTKDTNPGFQPFGFSGGLYDRDTGLVRFGARDYDARVGRWTTKDPIQFAGGDGNLYGYALNNPLFWIDSFGLDITVSFNPNAAAGLGHVGIGVNTPNTVGQRRQPGTSDLQTVLGRDVPGRISADPAAPSKITIPTTLAQDRKAQQCIDTREQQQKNYSFDVNPY